MGTPTIAFRVILLLTFTIQAFALECPPFPQQVSKDLDLDVKAAVVRIGPVKGGELTTKTQVATKDLMDKFPNAQRIYIEQLMYATFCTALRDDKTIPEGNKAKQLKDYAIGVRNAISSEQPAPKNSPVPKYGISNDQLNKLLEITGGQTRIVESLVEQLDEKDKTIKERDEKIEILGRKYAELKAEYYQKIQKGNLSKEDKADLSVAKEKLDAGDLKGAEKILRPNPPTNFRIIQ